MTLSIFILTEVLSECTRNKVSVYSSKTDVNQNCVDTIYCVFVSANLICEFMSKATTHSLY